MPPKRPSLHLVPAARFLQDRAESGWGRAKSALFPAIQMTLCAVSAYSFAFFVLGHKNPYFAATAALIATGFASGLRTRRVIEVAVGCSLGIFMGELILLNFGRGIWQGAVAIFLSILLARFIDRGVILATQLAVQSALVIFLISPSNVPLERSLDAVVGGVVALIATLLTPSDPRREPYKEIQQLLSTLAHVLRDCQRALTENDSTSAWHALIRARNSQPKLDSVRQALDSAAEVARLSPAYRKHRGELRRLRNSMEHVDFAFRNSRVFARRLSSAINNAALTDLTEGVLGEVLADLSDAVDTLGSGLSERSSTESAVLLSQCRAELNSIARRLHPETLGVAGLEGQAVVVLLRPLCSDLMVAAGMHAKDARAVMPQL